MTKYDKKDIKSWKGDKGAESYFACSPTSWFTIWRGLVWDQFCQHKFGYALQPVAIIAALILGIFTNNWYPLIILIVLNVILRGSWMVNFFRFAKSLADNGTGIRVDYLGLSLIVKNDTTGIFARSLTEKWCDIKEVRVYKTFIIVEMRDGSDGLSMFYLHPGNLKKCLDTILWYWGKTQQSRSPESVFPTGYSDEERNDICAYLGLKFGSIAFIDEEESDGKMPIAVAYIPPADGRDYYTFCTIGAGALAKAEDEDSAKTGEVTERREFIMYVPRSFGLNENNYGNDDKRWPSGILKTLAHDLPGRNHVWDCMDIIDFGKPLDESTIACGASLDYPLPDMGSHLYVSLPSGITVEFLQVIPISSKEVSSGNYEKLMATVLGIPAEPMEKEGFDEIITQLGPDVCKNALLKHFESLLKKPSS